MAEEVGIVMKLYDQVSPTLKTIASNNKSFDKSLDDLEASLKTYDKTQTALVNKSSELKKALEGANLAVTDARKEYRKLKDEASKGTLDSAIEEQARLRRELTETESAIRSNSAAYNELYRQTKNAATEMRKAENRAGGGLGGLVKGLATGQVGQLAASSISGFLDYAMTSAIGVPEASLLSNSLGGLVSGATAGAVAGLPGIIAGGVVGLASGALSGITEIESSKDDAFRNYVQEAVEGQLEEMDAIRSSGSATAGQREQDQIAFARRFGSDEAARDYLDQVKAMAVHTNYTYDEITGYSKSLLNTYSAEETLGVLQDLSDATAGLNLDSSGVSMFIAGLSRMRTTNKVTQEYLNYFSERGLDVYDALSRSTGADKSQIAGMVTAGSISGTDAAQAILDYIQEEFGGLSEKLSSTYDAMVDNLGDAEANLNARMGEGYNEARKEGLQAQMDWLESDELGEAYEAIGAWKAELENAKEQYIRDAVNEAMDSQAYQTAQAQGDAAEMGRIIMQAKIDGMNEYNASEGAQLALESELSLIESVRNSTATNDAYWETGYTLGQKFSEGLVAARRANAANDTRPEGYTDYLPEQYRAMVESGGGTATEDTASPSTSFLPAQYRRMVENGAAAGYAVGLNYVPYDNFPALLHQGERVLTAREARELDGLGAGPSLTPLLMWQTGRERAEPGGNTPGTAGTTVQVTVSGNTFGAGMDAEAVAAAIADKITLKLQAGYRG